MPRGSNAKRERQYDRLKRKFQRSGRYAGRQEEVAARIVNKQRKEYGETQGERRKDREGRSPDRALPIRDYQHLTVPEVKRRIDDLDRRQLEHVRRYEREHKQRKTVLRAIDQRLSA